MATMKDMFQAMLDKLERQAKKLALVEHEAERYEKLAHTWEERALKAEKKLADSVNWQESSERNWAGWQNESERNEALQERVNQAEEHIRFLMSCAESGERLVHEDYARIGRWLRAEAQCEEVATNSTGDSKR